MTWHDARSWLIHLRIGFQLCLSPIFLLGYVVAGGGIDRNLILGYVAFHLFGYAGGTAFNSVYDRDTGPIGGLEKPPPIPPGLLPFSLVWQLIGLGLALLVNVPLAIIYVIMFLMSCAYSHPWTRWKARPLVGLTTVAVGQGILGYLAGWVCAGGPLAAAFLPPALLGMLAATLITLGFYPLTGIYQIKEDLSRGDRTFPVWQGPARSFNFALCCLILGGSSAVLLVAVRYRVIEAAVLGFVLFCLLFAIWRWSIAFDPDDVIYNFRRIMRLYSYTSFGFIGWLGLHLLRIL